jgi:hypothetical protein
MDAWQVSNAARVRLDFPLKQQFPKPPLWSWWSLCFNPFFFVSFVYFVVQLFFVGL